VSVSRDPIGKQGRTTGGARKSDVSLSELFLALLITLSFVFALFPLIGKRWSFCLLVVWLVVGVWWLGRMIRHAFSKLIRGRGEPSGQAGRPLRERLRSYLIPGWRSFTATALAVTMCASGWSVPGTYIYRLSLGLVLLLVLSLIWLGRVVAMGYIRRFGLVKLGRVRPAPWYLWALQPALILLLVALVFTHAPRWLTFFASKVNMDRQARAVLFDGKNARSIRRAGLFNIDYAVREGSTVTFIIKGAGHSNPYGYCYQLPRWTKYGCVYHNYDFEHWYGHWYGGQVESGD
jgi:hypothetical protein